MTFRSTLRLAACAFLVAALPASAALYKWNDENGRVVYGDTPPPGVKAERIVTTVAPADPNAIRGLSATDAQIKKRQQEREEATAKAQKAEADAKTKLDNCTQIRGRLELLRSDQMVFHFDDKGDKVFYDAAQRKNQIAESEKQLLELACPPAS